MKKLIITALILAMALAMCACNNTPSPTATPAPSTSSYQGPQTYTWPKTKMGDMPDPGKTIYTMAQDSTGVSCDYLNFPEEELREYITKVQEAGFIYEAPDSEVLAQTNDLSSGGFMYMAFNKAGETARVIFTNTRYTVITYRPADAGASDGAVVMTAVPDAQ